LPCALPDYKEDKRRAASFLTLELLRLHLAQLLRLHLAQQKRVVAKLGAGHFESAIVMQWSCDLLRLVER
jgi:hypothetical protein